MSFPLTLHRFFFLSMLFPMINQRTKSLSSISTLHSLFNTFSTFLQSNLTRTTFIFVSTREQLHSFEFAETSDKSTSLFVKISSNTNHSTFVFLHHLQRKSKDEKKNNECLSLQRSFLRRRRISSSIFII